ncbi:MAG: leucine-rich repeat domain-containing protein [Oscillospiraceae bacterium]|nr:leucine-rich repeat domain-containing protein [Oscillospiraceae bacterium]
MPDSVTVIGAHAFDGCDQLVEIKIPDSVTWIGSCAFQNCDNLSRVTLPDGISYLGSGSFDENVIVTYKGTNYVFDSEFKDLYAAISGE